MGLFSSDSAVVYGAVIDIGSGSVMAALVSSSPQTAYPEIIWSKREYIPLMAETHDSSAKRVMSSLVNVMLLLETEGKATMSELIGHQTITDLQITIAAPWSYTVTKTISYTKDEAFNVTKALMDELSQAAQQKVADELVENERLHQFGLNIINRVTIATLANGYLFKLNNRQHANTLQVVECSAVAQEYLTNAISEVRDKVLPKTTVKMYSFMLCFYNLQQALVPEPQELCLVDITFEATEIGIVRDGLLQYCTHTPIGTYTLARSIAETLRLPYAEAFGMLQRDNFEIAVKQYSQKQQTIITDIMSEYEDQLVKLFSETGDKLSIPKLIYLHGNLRSENLFKKYLKQAAERSTGSTHYVQPVTEVILSKIYPKEAITIFNQPDVDTAMLLSAQFFHTQRQATRPKLD